MADGIGITPDGGDALDITLDPITVPFRPGIPEPEPIPGPVIPKPNPNPTPAPVPVPVPVPEPGGTSGTLGGLPDLGWLGLLLAVLGLIALAAALTEFFNWLFKTILGPLPGGRQVNALTSKVLTQPLSNALGKAYQGVDGQIGLSFTTLGDLTNQVGQAIAAAEEVIYISAVKLAALAGSTTGVHEKADNALSRAKLAQRAAEVVTQQSLIEKHRAEQAEQQLETHVDVLQHNITHLLEPELDGLRHRIGELERGATTTWDEILKHEELLGASALTAATAFALRRLGADWIQCETNKRIGSAFCGTPGNWLARLLKGALPLLAFSDLCAVLKGASALLNTDAVRGSISLGADGIADLMHCAGAEGADPLNTVYYTPGPITVWGSPGAIASQL